MIHIVFGNLHNFNVNYGRISAIFRYLVFAALQIIDQHALQIIDQHETTKHLVPLQGFMASVRNHFRKLLTTKIK